MSAEGLWSSHTFAWAVQTRFQKPQSPGTFFSLQGNALVKPGRGKAAFSEMKQVIFQHLEAETVATEVAEVKACINIHAGATGI